MTRAKKQFGPPYVTLLLPLDRCTRCGKPSKTITAEDTPELMDFLRDTFKRYELVQEIRRRKQGCAMAPKCGVYVCLTEGAAGWSQS